jgi:hypothetical protein
MILAYLQNGFFGFGSAYTVTPRCISQQSSGQSQPIGAVECRSGIPNEPHEVFTHKQHKAGLSSPPNTEIRTFRGKEFFGLICWQVQQRDGFFSRETEFCLGVFGELWFRKSGVRVPAATLS